MFDVSYQSTTLANGVKVGTAYLPQAVSASVGIWCNAGSRHERAAENGVAHFVEHMVFKGTKRRSARKISMEIEGVGGELNAFTSEDHTCYHAWLPAKWFGRALRVLSDMYCNAELKQRAFENEREVIFEEIEMYRDNPGQHVEDLLSHALWNGHQLARPICGTEQSLERITPDVLRRWIEEKHVGHNTVVAVAGPVPHDQVVREVERQLGGMESGRRPAMRAVKSPQRPWLLEGGFVGDERDIGQVHFGLGFRGPSRKDDARFAFKLLNVMLGETMSSRLFQALRERRAACYSVQSGVEMFDDVGVLDIHAGLDGDKAEAAVKMLGSELRKLRTQAPGVGELKDAKEFVIGQQSMWFEAVANQMQWVGDALSTVGHVPGPEEALKHVRDVTADDVQKMAQELFQPDRMGMAVVGAGVDGERLVRALGL
ncbi:M16 family metallopeptidase [Sulfuriroseicoccus oceanibius]|uniref:Insulinase family protein n=1 Tax=Sulfuriroseicoccus oceanibius TaxID=2707525 RepID=A0A6B3LBC2_9BACT|nr:pitrilysin family protein [Sulfuriroseicoccus oceanibius]QQL45561.1 insulinase family protein [Sulfuriroseicoccus oceanibius]